MNIFSFNNSYSATVPVNITLLVVGGQQISLLSPVIDAKSTGIAVIDQTAISSYSFFVPYKYLFLTRSAAHVASYSGVISMAITMNGVTVYGSPYSVGATNDAGDLFLNPTKLFTTGNTFAVEVVTAVSGFSVADIQIAVIGSLIP